MCWAEHSQSVAETALRQSSGDTACWTSWSEPPLHPTTPHPPLLSSHTQEKGESLQQKQLAGRTRTRTETAHVAIQPAGHYGPSLTFTPPPPPPPLSSHTQEKGESLQQKQLAARTRNRTETAHVAIQPAGHYGQSLPFTPPPTPLPFHSRSS